MATTYDLAPGKDPLWDAALARFKYEEEQKRRDTQLRLGRAGEAEARGIRELQDASALGSRRLAGNAESRGLLSSGLYEQAKADKAAKEGMATGEITRRANEERYNADADLTRALASLMVSREQEAANSRYRQAQQELQAQATAAAARPSTTIIQRPVAQARRPAAAATAPVAAPIRVPLPALGTGSFNSGVGNARPTTISRAKAKAI